MAKYIESLQGNTSSIEVVECGCGYHMGFDGSYLDQVGDIECECPACGCTINTANIPQLAE